MANPMIRIFPHSRDEFETTDDLKTWLLTALKARGGRYYLREGSKYGSNPPGSIILFRYGDEIVGEAVVEEDFTPEHKAESGFRYEGYIKFEPSSIRTYVGALSIETLERIVGRELKPARPYYKIDSWIVYPSILAEVVKEGFHQ